MKSTVFAIAMLTAIGATAPSSAQEAGIYGVEALPLAVDYGPGVYAHPTMEGVDKYQNGTYLEFSDIIEAYSERISKQLERLLGLDRIQIKFLRDIKIMDAVIDVTNSRQNFLK
jgi:hypothetical protein